MEAVVLFNYTKEQDDELSLNVGDTVTDVTIIEEGWCEGTLNGIKGVFPENFVKLKPKVEQADVPKLRKLPYVAESADNTRKRRAKVAFSYTAENSDELSLPLGSTVEILGEDEEGWWRGKLDGKEGVFPSNFVQLIEETEEGGTSPPPYSNITPSKPAEKARPPSMIAMPGLGGINPNELRQKLKPVSPATGPPPSEVTAPAPIPKSAPVPTIQESQPQKAKVMFSYNADQDDEVSVTEGDTVDIISTKTDQDGWWKIRAGGKVGLVPDNFLSAIPSSASPKVPEIVEAIDNPPLPPKSTAPPAAVVPKPKPPSTSSITKHPKSAVELPKLPSKQPELPKKEPAELDIPRQDVLDSKVARDKPKRTARPPSRNTSTADISEEKETEPEKGNQSPPTSGVAPWQQELKKRKPRPTPPTVPGGSEPAKPPTTAAKPAPDIRPKPKPSKPTPTVTPKPAEPSPPAPSVAPAPSKPTAPSKTPANKEGALPSAPAPVVASPPDNSWKEAFEELQGQFKTFQEKLRQEMQKEIDILSKDLDDERKKVASMQIDIDRLKKAREYRDSL
ncbi:PREDICTED: SH3 domain-containing kinase-binding protein 1-like isoform X1 [Amphimedon queenslandica]|uniref:SH3 domain-containing protein n=1 Tax=Amphimedon queenslandica TaxID=400682 RepID=A0AAN0J3J3_AMPQE|nr:PREDICTED: SH3 domain-containing kinase-binding protein 1-like isoform X1 [Amphimedon queenslandica]|eukprot:XP_019851292.1 PREDICTED: SH3 domain-containing kinase-binding protein 1-like isoform X1 [Amphimedon queenslandica]